MSNSLSSESVTASRHLQWQPVLGNRNTLDVAQKRATCIRRGRRGRQGKARRPPWPLNNRVNGLMRHAANSQGVSCTPTYLQARLTEAGSSSQSRPGRMDYNNCRLQSASATVKCHRLWQEDDDSIDSRVEAATQPPTRQQPQQAAANNGACWPSNVSAKHLD